MLFIIVSFRILLSTPCSILFSILFYTITLEGRRGTTNEFATIPFHLVLFSAVLVELQVKEGNKDNSGIIFHICS